MPGILFPSFHEGFSIPTIEAKGCGCAVVASNRSSGPEAGSDAALYSNPYDKLEIALEKALTDEQLRLHLKISGTERAKAFSGEITAAQTLQLYKEFVEGQLTLRQ